MIEAWKALLPPPESGTRNVLFADSSHPLDFRIGRDSRGRYVFLLDALGPSGGRPALPKVMGINIEMDVLPAERVRLVLTLHDGSDLQNFCLMCSGLMLATRTVSPSHSSEGLMKTLEELHRWHEMLKRRRDSRLTRSERIGLVGELLFLRDALVPRIGIGPSVQAWTGHERHEQDFVIGSAIFEVKTQIVTADRMISIASEDQLDPVQGRILVCNQGIAPAPEGTPGSCTLNSLARELAELATRAGGGVSDLFAIAILSAGYEPHQEYDEDTWTLVDRALYGVRDDFPRIERRDLRRGVEQVRYKVRVSDCQPYALDMDATFEELIHG